MPYTNFAYMKPVYQPAMRIITNITQSNPATVTTSFNHNYLTGTIVRINVFDDVRVQNPVTTIGMPQINQMFGTIVVTSPTTFNISIDSTYFDPFVVPNPIPLNFTAPQCVPIGEDNDILTAAVQNVLPYPAT